MRSTCILISLFSLFAVQGLAQQVKEKLPPVKERGKAATSVPRNLYPDGSEKVLIPELTEVPVLLRDTLHTG